MQYNIYEEGETSTEEGGNSLDHRVNRVMALSAF
jgi:hypothetical protein